MWGGLFLARLGLVVVRLFFWPAARFGRGIRQCIVAGKYPKEFENLNGLDACLRVRFWVRRLSSSASMTPRRVMARVVSLRWKGMVIGGIVIGGMLWEMKNAAKVLPISRRLMGLINR